MDKFYMEKALELARKAEGFTYSNPMVGALIVKKDRIIGQGYHEEYGKNHAEINAIESAGEEVRDSTIYVSLEPCSHYGKTPPCVDAIIDAGISRVVIACLDPNPLVAGKGVEALKKAGIKVEVGVLEKEARKLNEVFFKNIETDYPFLAIKSAMTLDGKLATRTGKSKWISNIKSRYFVHELRHKYTGIMVGINTVLKDNPKLNTRIDGLVSPFKLVVDSHLKIPLDANILKDRPEDLIIGTCEDSCLEKSEYLESLGVRIIKTPALDGRVDLDLFLKEVKKLGINSILVEGGGCLNFSLLEKKLVDKLYLFIAPKIFGGPGVSFVSGKGVDLVEDSFKLKNYKIRQFDEDILLEGYLEVD